MQTSAKLRAAIDAELEPLPADLTGSQFQQEILREAIRNLRRAERDPNVTPREKAALAASATNAIRHLAKLRGEVEVTATQILRSRCFAEIMTAIEEGLASFGRPEILEAVSTRLKAIEG